MTLIEQENEVPGWGPKAVLFFLPGGSTRRGKPHYFHFMLHPILGICSHSIVWPAIMESSAIRISFPVTGFPFPGLESSNCPLYMHFRFSVINEKVRGAGGVIGLGDFLRFIEQVGKRVSLLLRDFLHSLRRIIRIILNIV